MATKIALSVESSSTLRHCSICQLYTPKTRECEYDIAFSIAFTSRRASGRKVCPREDEAFKNHEVLVDPLNIAPFKERLAYQSD